MRSGNRISALVLLAALPGCGAPERANVVHVAKAAELELPPVLAAPARLQVTAYGLEPGAGPEMGECAVRLLDPVNRVEWHIEAAQAWEESEQRADTTFIRHTVIGDYVPADLATYGMSAGQVIRVDCAAYGVLGLARSGG
ncbi:MAG: hypothetical protein Q8N53_00685 [Longimicrobiales bacterium]|nr:hypothetical protein [Longimicrobiales bacterium]